MPRVPLVDQTVRLRREGLAPRVAVLCVLLISSGLASGDDAGPGGGPVIPPGREELLAEMLGRGATVLAGCSFAGGQADGAAIRATYRCGEGDVVFELRHPSRAPASAPQTSRFALMVASGSPPAALTEALQARIRAREAAFEWVWPSPSAVPPSRPGLPEPSALSIVAGAAAALVAAAALGLLARRRLARLGRAAGRWASQHLARANRGARRWMRQRVTGWRRAASRVARDPLGQMTLLLGDERFWVLAILVASALARGWLCIVNRESNDDHAIVAHMIRNGGWLPPASSACMECSHAKLYHYVLAAAFEYVARSGEASRMLGNLLNFVAGTVLLVLFSVYSHRLRCGPQVRVLGLAFMSFNAALVGIFSQTTNDGFVILFSSLAIFFVARFLEDRKLKPVILATLFAILAAASKASGWTIFVGGGAVLAAALVGAAPLLRRRYAAAAAIFVLGFLSVVPLVHPYRENIARAHTPFVNDAFETPVMTLEVPRPSTWMLQNFFTFRIAELLRVPYDDYQGGPYPLHRESLWSQLYGRMFFLRFDQGIWRNGEPRLLDLGRLSLVLGLLPLAALLLGTASVARWSARGLWTRGLGWLTAQHDWQHLVYVGVVVASLLAVLIEYHRLQWLFIWMKAIYLFPAILSLFALFLTGLELLWQRWPRLVTGWMIAMVTVSIADLGWLLHDLTRTPPQ